MMLLYFFVISVMSVVVLLSHSGQGGQIGDNIPEGKYIGKPVDCPHKTFNMADVLVNDYPIHPEDIVDVKHKILMNWTPKSACTKSVAMFFQHMNMIYGRDYGGFPHQLRSFYYQTCGKAQASYFTDPSWFRFKMVRNPFTRFVSSYYHTMRMVDSRSGFPKDISGMSLLGFLKFLEDHPLEMVTRNHGYHFSVQHLGFELYAHMNHQPSPFHKIVHVENSEQEIAELNAMLRQRGNAGRPFSFTTEYDDRRDYRVRSNITRFVGDEPWRVMKDLELMDYRYFYTPDMRRRVERLYHWDFVLYNYTWPF